MSVLRRYFYQLVTVAGLSCANTVSAGGIAILGDSLSTGGASHEALQFDFDLLSQVFADQVSLQPTPGYYGLLQDSWATSIEQPAQPPRRLNLSRREFEDPFTWVGDNAALHLSKRYLDTEEYSWAYLLGRKKQLSPDQILIAARDGERSEHAVRQVDRLLDAGLAEAPRHLFAFFTGNDLCGPTADFATAARDYAVNQEKALRYYMRNTKPNPVEGLSHIWLLDPMAVLQIVSSPEILSRPVRAYGQDLTCRELQSGRFASQANDLGQKSASEKFLFNLMFGQGPRSYCPSIFSVHGENGAETQMKLAATLSAYRQEMVKMVKRLENIDPIFKVHHLRDTADIAFTGEDIGNDCFHLSLKGQLKLAKIIDAAIARELPEF